MKIREKLVEQMALISELWRGHLKIFKDSEWAYWPCSMAALRVASGWLEPFGFCTKRFFLRASSSQESSLRKSITCLACPSPEDPQAPCLLVRMFKILSTSLDAVTLSRLLAAVIRWSHIFSSSFRSVFDWAHSDWNKKNILLILKYKVFITKR